MKSEKHISRYSTTDVIPIGKNSASGISPPHAIQKLLILAIKRFDLCVQRQGCSGHVMISVIIIFRIKTFLFSFCDQNFSVMKLALLFFSLLELGLCSDVNIFINILKAVSIGDYFGFFVVLNSEEETSEKLFYENLARSFRTHFKYSMVAQIPIEKYKPYQRMNMNKRCLKILNGRSEIMKRKFLNVSAVKYFDFEQQQRNGDSGALSRVDTCRAGQFRIAMSEL